MSKSGKSLARYFPEIVAVLAATHERDFVVDGELILPIGEILSFDALQARLHPAQSRIARLSVETPAKLMLFDCLALSGRDMVDAPVEERRTAIERFHASRTTPATDRYPESGRAGSANAERPGTPPSRPRRQNQR